MKKICYIAIIALSFILFSCQENLDTDLPVTDYTKYKTDTGYTFPVGTYAIDIYNCLSASDLSSATGTYTHTETATLNGNPYTDTVTKTISSVKIYSNTNSQIYTYYTVFTFSDDTSITYTYQFQRENCNVWKNDKTDSILVITL